LIESLTCSHRADPAWYSGSRPDDLSRAIGRHTLIQGIAHHVLPRHRARSPEQGFDMPTNEVGASSRLSQGRVKNSDLFDHLQAGVWRLRVRYAGIRSLVELNPVSGTPTTFLMRVRTKNASPVSCLGRRELNQFDGYVTQPRGALKSRHLKVGAEFRSGEALHRDLKS